MVEFSKSRNRKIAKIDNILNFGLEVVQRIFFRGVRAQVTSPAPRRSKEKIYNSKGGPGGEAPTEEKFQIVSKSESPRSENAPKKKDVGGSAFKNGAKHI